MKSMTKSSRAIDCKEASQLYQNRWLDATSHPRTTFSLLLPEWPDRVVAMENASTKSPPDLLPEQPTLSTAQPPYAPAAEPGPVPPQPEPPHEGPTAPAEETDVWWGAYSGWAMAPSWLACLLLTGLIAWGGWALVPRGFVQGTVLGLAGAVWLVQGVRWGYRVFGYNYRLTTRRVYADRGFLYEGFASRDLAAIARVLVKRSWSDRLVGVGQVCLVPEEQTKPPLVLEGVRRPYIIAARIRELVQVARGGEASAPCERRGVSPP
jgi:hypothetical protein